MGVMVFGALAHLVVTMVHERKQQFAVLRALGFTRRQVRAAVVWLASMLALVTAAIAIPAGFVTGRAIWLDRAASIHVLPESRFPWASVGVGFAVLLVVANLIAIVPARRAARSTTAHVLRSE